MKQLCLFAVLFVMLQLSLAQDQGGGGTGYPRPTPSRPPPPTRRPSPRPTQTLSPRPITRSPSPRPVTRSPSPRPVTRSPSPRPITRSPSPRPTRSPSPSPSPVDCCTLAFNSCLFRFAGSLTPPTVLLTGLTPDVPITPRIVFKSPPFPGAQLGIANANRPTEVVGREDGGRGAVVVSELPDDGSGVQKFTPTQFKTVMTAENRTAISYETFQGNLEYAGDLCVRVFLTHYQILDAEGLVLDNVNDAGPDSCVVFRTALDELGLDDE